jgi:hypothetical protein
MSPRKDVEQFLSLAHLQRHCETLHKECFKLKEYSCNVEAIYFQSN